MSATRGKGRPTKLTPELAERILTLVKLGNFREVAAEQVGIPAETMARWMTRAREPYRTFAAKVVETERTAETLLVGKIMSAAIAGDLDACKWYLTRKFPERWGVKDRMEHEAGKGLGSFLEVVKHAYEIRNRNRNA